MHAALDDPQGGPDFAPEPFNSAASQKLYDEIREQSDITFGLLKKKQGTLPQDEIAGVQHVLKLENQIANRFAPLRERHLDVTRIRCQGDFHLGQVLHTGSDFMIIDFEGEPARPMEARRDKMLALRDVAGMLRSFQYAGFASLFGQVPGLTPKPEQLSRIEAWAAFWTGCVSAAYLNGYFAEAADRFFVPKTLDDKRVVLDILLLHKAFYEIAYELNNRPDWVRIPLRGVLSLVA
jgi:maltose alpha-D-glucosyltransferase/alpha-amylase